MICSPAVTVGALFLGALGATVSNSPAAVIHSGSIGAWLLLASQFLVSLGCSFAPLEALRVLGWEQRS
jgi:hypothetical protein